MSFKTTLIAAVAAVTLSSGAWAEDMAEKIMIMDPYVRSAMKSATTGAAFMTLMNKTDQDDRLIRASSEIAERVELHTHIEDENGVMQMREVEDGFVVPAGGAHLLQRGGDHVMFMGLKQPLTDGETVSVTLTFEQAGEVVVEVPVDLMRKPKHGMKQHKMGSGG
ncbi:copper chaperone PCu(A)C [Sedimentitalea sp. HM32M-2]|uniref:copper chaperone PCu(A)C n=1 Tax=Sedimentitalea sp. HM32M-2 TaxID=3351566 RepID=UPI00363359A3